MPAHTDTQVCRVSGSSYLVDNLQVVGGDLGVALTTAQGGHQAWTVQTALENNDESKNQDNDQDYVDPPRRGDWRSIIPRC